MTDIKPDPELLAAGLTEEQALAAMGAVAALCAAAKAYSETPKCPIHHPWICQPEEKGCTHYGKKKPA